MVLIKPAALNATVRQLKIFEAVARHLSFTQAARELHLTQPAVSMQVKQLEQVVGMPLLNQTGRRIRVTEAGAEIQRCARVVMAQLVDSEQTLREMKRLERGALHLGVTSTVNYFLTPVLGAFTREHPNVDIHLEVTNRGMLLDRLSCNEPDLVLMGQPPDDLDLVADSFMTNPLVIIAPPDHVLAKKRRVALKTLSNQTFLLREPGSGTRITMERVFDEQQLEVSSSLSMSSNEAIKQGVEAGLGLGFVSRHTIANELELKQLCELRVDGFPVLRQWYVVHRADRKLSSVAAAFRKFVLSESRRLG
ncbi:MAG: LysR family transcriptional regulator [Thiotrichales bacterium]|nr:LysR family transcriptional regulator [Thiotrichales bacterium]|tara:strand:+ start:109 stop:1029 length:921 start_codon:yes stop_codon:yes gene_type:complete